MANMKITSDGTPMGTHVTVDGVKVEGVEAVEWGIALRGKVRATLVVKRVELEYEGAVEPSTALDMSTELDDPGERLMINSRDEETGEHIDVCVSRENAVALRDALSTELDT